MGVSVNHITGENGHSPIWAYFATTLTLMALTLGSWFIWYREITVLGLKTQSRNYVPKASCGIATIFRLQATHSLGIADPTEVQTLLVPFPSCFFRGQSTLK